MSHRKTLPRRCKCCKSLIPDSSAAYSIFDDENNIEFLLFDCFGRKFDISEGLDQVICYDCLSQLQQSYEFKLKLLNNDKVLNPELDEEAIQNEAEDVHVVITSYNDSEMVFEENSEDNFDEIIQTEPSNIEVDASDEIFTEASDYENNFIEIEVCNLQDIAEFNETSQIVTGNPNYFDESEICQTKNDLIENRNEIRRKNLNYGEALTDVITLDTLRRRIIKDIPVHKRKPPKPKEIEEPRSLDLEKIRTSDDLINILEDDYQCENGSKPKRLVDEDTADEFKIPKIEIIDVCENIEYLDEEKPFKFDEYFSSIVSISYDECSDFIEPFFCSLCEASHLISNFESLMIHTLSVHLQHGQCNCIMELCCKSFKTDAELKNHLFLVHQNVVKPIITISCTTCTQQFDSIVLFGKHICLADSYRERSEDEDYSCNNCDKKLTSQKRLLFHKQFHLENARPKCCVICELLFDDDSRFFEHVMFAHEKIFEYFCTFCDKSFSVEAELSRHERLHAADRIYECEECGKSFCNVPTLRDHYLSHTTKLKCDICKKTYGRISRLRTHMLTHETKPMTELPICEQCGNVFENDALALQHFSLLHNATNADEILLSYLNLNIVLCCEFCEMTFVDRILLKKHKKIHTGTQPYECCYCVAKYESYSRLKTHKNIHSNRINRYPVHRHYICDVENCTKTYRQWSSLVSHRKTFHLLNPSIFKCALCSKTFYTTTKLSAHKRSEHEIGLNCPMCKMIFVSKIALDQHFARTHIRHTKLSKRKSIRSKYDANKKYIRYVSEENGLFYCKECGKNCNNRSNIIQHVEMVHLQILNYFCNECKKGFYLRSDLTDHQRMHTLEAPFKCKFCDYRNRRQSVVKLHERKHTNERPYKCPDCPKSFKRLYVMKNHAKKHNGVREFVCEIVDCGKTFITQAAANFHIKHKHNIITCSFVEESNGCPDIDEQFHAFRDIDKVIECES